MWNITHFQKGNNDQNKAHNIIIFFVFPINDTIMTKIIFVIPIIELWKFIFVILVMNCCVCLLLLLQRYEELGDINIEEAVVKFDDLVAAARQGDTDTLRDLLMDHVPLLPQCAKIDPLVEAIRHDQRDTVFFLLCAGAPLCNRSIEDLTPLEVAHNTLGLPACFPALIRKVLYHGSDIYM